MNDVPTRDNIIQALAVFLCRIAGIEPVDPMDGSPNWWIFNEQATNVIGDLEKRGFLKLYKWGHVNSGEPHAD